MLIYLYISNTDMIISMYNIRLLFQVFNRFKINHQHQNRYLVKYIHIIEIKCLDSLKSKVFNALASEEMFFCQSWHY